MGPVIEQEIGPETGSWALSMMPVPVPSPEMGEAAIGVVRTGRLAAFTLTRILLAL